VEIELLNEAMWLEGRSDCCWLALISRYGDELIQFGSAERSEAADFDFRGYCAGVAERSGPPQ
jgi:hypothetical protein